MFCPACAASVEEGMVSCPKCGEPMVALPAPTRMIQALSGKPSAVRQAGILLWITVGLGLFSTISFGARFGFGNLDIRFFLELLVWLVAVVLTLRRSNPARVVLLVLVAYSVFNTLRNASAYFVHMEFSSAMWLVEVAVRLWASYLLLRPESNAWFRK
jgi:hypothetical protein